MVMTTCFNCSVEPIENSQTETLSIQEIAISNQAAAMNCNGSNPKARISHNGTLPADYEIYDASGAFIGAAYDVMPGSISDWITFPAGNVIFNITIDSMSDQKVGFSMETCTELNMQLDSNNELMDVQPQASSN